MRSKRYKQTIRARFETNGQCRQTFRSSTEYWEVGECIEQLAISETKSNPIAEANGGERQWKYHKGE
jgi:ABC-type cobalamin/Fe3+-siderophores transport system ATPase subunit